jgi:hypothetical protein
LHHCSSPVCLLPGKLSLAAKCPENYFSQTSQLNDATFTEPIFLILTYFHTSHQISEFNFLVLITFDFYTGCSYGDIGGSNESRPFESSKIWTPKHIVWTSLLQILLCCLLYIVITVTDKCKTHVGLFAPNLLSNKGVYFTRMQYLAKINVNVNFRFDARCVCVCQHQTMLTVVKFRQ